MDSNPWPFEHEAEHLTIPLWRYANSFTLHLTHEWKWKKLNHYTYAKTSAQRGLEPLALRTLDQPLNHSAMETCWLFHFHVTHIRKSPRFIPENSSYLQGWFKIFEALALNISNPHSFVYFFSPFLEISKNWSDPSPPCGSLCFTKGGATGSHRVGPPLRFLEFHGGGATRNRRGGRVRPPSAGH